MQDIGSSGQDPSCRVKHVDVRACFGWSLRCLCASENERRGSAWRVNVRAPQQLYRNEFLTFLRRALVTQAANRPKSSNSNLKSRRYLHRRHEDVHASSVPLRRCFRCGCSQDVSTRHKHLRLEVVVVWVWVEESIQVCLRCFCSGVRADSVLAYPVTSPQGTFKLAVRIESWLAYRSTMSSRCPPASRTSPTRLLPSLSSLV